MAYLGKTPSQAVRSRYYFTASGGETSLSGTDDNGNTLTYTDGDYVDVSLNGVALVAGSDYNTTTANTIGGLTALTASDVVEIVVYDTFSVFSGAFTGDISLGDNVKAKFGASDDLQIYHDGSNSYISELGIGNLKILGTNVELKNAADNASYLVASNGGSVQLYNNGAKKFETTSTGIDVTGTVTADDIAISDSSPTFTMTDTDTNALFRVSASSAVGSVTLEVDENGVGSNPQFLIQGQNVDRFRIDADSGDISFYADNGTTQGLFWDASTQRLGLGSTSPAATLNVNSGSANTNTIFESSDATVLCLYKDNVGSAQISSTSGDFKFATGGDTSYSGLANNLVITSGGNVGIGTTSPNVELEISGSSEMLRLQSTDTNKASIVGRGASADRWLLGTVASNDSVTLQATSATGELLFKTGGTNERMRIESGGTVLINKTSTDFNTAGIRMDSEVNVTRANATPVFINRTGNDGGLIQFYQAGVEEGSISVSGTTVSYNGGHLARWSQLADNTKDTSIVKGTVMTNLDQMAEWTKDGVTEDNEQLNCMAVSSVEGDANVAGVFVNWDDDDEDYTADMNIAMTGDMVIRIASGTTVARGDLLMSAGDGTAKPQGDDIVRSKTIAKVTSTTVSHTYDDGSYLVPCVLMAC